MNATTKRYYEIINAAKYSDGECHDISSVLCFIRDCDNDSERARAEALIHFFITKKKLGDPVIFKKLKEEFGF